ncbi:MAG TPA: TonB-dependent receptor [Gemmatimonadota bacterium]|nr:TonB-dependent receptor [Gemmatimonadota bacterium]
MKRTAATWLVLLLAGAGPLSAQVPEAAGARPARAGAGEVRGRVISAQAGEPIPGASVAVLDRISSSIVSGAVAGADGGFRIVGLPPGTYYVQVTSIGYASHRSPDFALDPETPSLDLGTIRLATDLVQADEIGVTVERPTITLEPDRSTYLAKDVAPAATTASEVLQAVPSVQVDPQGKVSLRGNENVAVHINGRPAPVQGEQLAAYLQQLPANVIDRVEVIPTPSARYDPEGMAGIINIALNQNTDLGTSAGLTVGLATAERYNLGANLGYQRGPLTLFTTYGSNWTERDVVGINNRERLDGGVPVSFTEQDLVGASGWEGHNLSTTLEVRPGEGDLVTNSLVLNRRRSTDDQVSAYTVLDGSQAVTDRFDRPRDQASKAFVIDYTLGFKRTYEPREHELSAELRFNRADDEDRNDLWRQPPAAAGPRIELETNDVDALTRELIGQLDYTRPLGGSAKVETGYKGSARWTDREYVVLEDPLGTGEWVRSDLSNAFDFSEGVQAVYGVLSRSVGKLELQAGLRAEYASQDFTLSDASFPNDYASLFPSGLAVYNASEATQIKLSYSRRIKRPNTHELNPFPVFFDEQNVFFGNPELDPEYTDALELGYTRSGALGSFQLTPFYRHTTDIIRFIVDTDAVVDDREVTTITFENLASSDSWGADVNGSLDLGKWFNGFASFNVFKMVTDGGSETSLSSNAVTWSARVNGTTELTPSLSLQAMYFYRAPMEFERGRFSSWKMASITLRQKLWDDRASLSLRFADPFDTMGFRVEAGDEHVFQVTERDFDARALHLTFQYNFGTAPKVRSPRSEPAQEPTTGFP